MKKEYEAHGEINHRKDKRVVFLSDSLIGVIEGPIDLKKERDERLARFERPSDMPNSSENK